MGLMSAFLPMAQDPHPRTCAPREAFLVPDLPSIESHSQQQGVHTRGMGGSGKQAPHCPVPNAERSQVGPTHGGGGVAGNPKLGSGSGHTPVPPPR